MAEDGSEIENLTDQNTLASQELELPANSETKKCN